MSSDAGRQSGQNGWPGESEKAERSRAQCISAAAIRTPSNTRTFRQILTNPDIFGDLSLVDRFNDTGLDPEQTIHRQVWASEGDPKGQVIFLPTTGRRLTRSREGWRGGCGLVRLRVFALLRVSHGLDGGADGSAIDKPVPKWHHIGMEQVLEEPRKRITARVSDRVRDTLEQAAELLGATVNQFVVQTAYVEAQRVIERESVIRLSQKDAHRILALLDNPPKPNKRLKDAVKTYKGMVRA